MTGNGSLLYQINTRPWLRRRVTPSGRTPTLFDVPDDDLDRLAEIGVSWVWMLSVWQTGVSSREVSRSHPQWRSEFESTLPDLEDSDIEGSGFAITGYNVHAELGGDVALADLRRRLQSRGMRLMLDFVPNHMGLDHPWLESNPDYFLSGTECDLQSHPQNFIRVSTSRGPRVIAHGRDPNFDGWPDTLQLNYANEALHRAMTAILKKIAGQCDGVRCDMAMLMEPNVFARTWGQRMPPFWPEAITATRTLHPGFLFLGEVYWDMEWDLLNQGFDFTYDKRLYDRLRIGDASLLRAHLAADESYQSRMLRFLENHDEPRAASVFPLPKHRAAATLMLLSPGMKLLHDGQIEGFRKHLSPHLVRAPIEPVNTEVRSLYLELLPWMMRLQREARDWRSIEPEEAWHGNATFRNYVVGVRSQGERPPVWVLAVNYSDEASQCHVRLPFDGLANRSWTFTNRLGRGAYDWHGRDLLGKGLYLEMDPWEVVLFEVQPAGADPT